MISTHEKDLCEKNGPDFSDYWLKNLKMANFLQWAAAGSENIKWFDYKITSIFGLQPNLATSCCW
jgi:hypothetical protein